jgi:serine/threonine protein kinase
VEIDIPGDLPVVPYASLEGTKLITTPGAIHKIVKFEQKLYIYKVALLPDHIDQLAQEVRHYELQKGSKWIPKLGGKVCRQSRNEGILIEFFEKGDLRNHYHAKEAIKYRWITEIVTALLEFEALDFFYQDIRCANIVLDDNDSVRFINPGNTLVMEEWIHPDNLRSYIYSTSMSN